MVQYIITPWRNRRELLNVRQAFYPPPETDAARRDDDRRMAVALVSVWVQRGNCPHSVESTALLVAAVLNETVANSAYAMRAAYSTAFCRFVTGLLDGYQDKKHKLSMYSVAKNIGLPATFVELRHQCTHEELPTLSKLKAAADRSLRWIWDHYWSNLETSPTPIGIEECRSILEEYLRWRAGVESQDENDRQAFAARLGRWTASQVLEVLMQSMDIYAMDTGMLLYSLRISSAILDGREDYLASDVVVEPSGKMGTGALESIRTEMEIAKKALEENQTPPEASTLSSQNMEVEKDGHIEGTTGWVKWKGPWKPKSIGVV